MCAFGPKEERSFLETFCERPARSEDGKVRLGGGGAGPTGPELLVALEAREALALMPGCFEVLQGRCRRAFCMTKERAFLRPCFAPSVPLASEESTKRKVCCFGWERSRLCCCWGGGGGGCWKMDLLLETKPTEPAVWLLTMLAIIIVSSLKVALMKEDGSLGAVW